VQADKREIVATDCGGCETRRDRVNRLPLFMFVFRAFSTGLLMLLFANVKPRAFLTIARS
jgi:hypothetical protein